MKYKLNTLMIFLFTVQSMSAQSKKETEEWIITKFQEYSLVNNRDNNLLGNTHTLTIQNGNLILFDKLNNDTILYEKIPINKISTFDMSEVEKKYEGGYALYLFCQNRNYCIEQGTFIEGQNKFIKDNSINNYHIMLRLNSGFGENNIPNRMVKAIKHLVKLYGVKEIKEEREAF